MKISILGTEYDFDLMPHNEDARLAECDGYTDFFEKTIRVDTDLTENAPMAIKDFPAYRRKVKRHEIVHAYFFESGLTEWANNECLVDWIAVQFPKMFETLKEVEAI